MFVSNGKYINCRIYQLESKNLYFIIYNRSDTAVVLVSTSIITDEVLLKISSRQKYQYIRFCNSQLRLNHLQCIFNLVANCGKTALPNTLKIGLTMKFWYQRDQQVLHYYFHYQSYISFLWDIHT